MCRAHPARQRARPGRCRDPRLASCSRHSAWTPAAYEFETYADEWGANVTAYLLLDGMRTSMTVSVGFGAEGAITWASGFLGTAERGADYPRIGIEAAVQRLNDQSSSWMASRHWRRPRRPGSHLPKPARLPRHPPWMQPPMPSRPTHRPRCPPR